MKIVIDCPICDKETVYDADLKKTLREIEKRLIVSALKMSEGKLHCTKLTPCTFIAKPAQKLGLAPLEEQMVLW